MGKDGKQIEMKRKFLLALILISVPMISTGCWNKTELSDLAFVTALGIDRVENTNELKVSFQIVVPSNVTTGITGGAAQGLPIVVVSSKAKNIIEAGRKATKKVSRRLYYAHCNVVAISEDVAKEGIKEIFDALERDPEFRTTATVVVTKNSSAKDVVSSLTVLDKIPAKKIVKALEWSERVSGENLVRNIDDVITAFASKGKQPIVGGVTFSGDRKKAKKMSGIESSVLAGIIRGSGIALFKEDKLVGWIEGEGAKGVLRLQNKLNQAPEYVGWKGKKEAVGMKVLRSNTSIKAHFINKKPKIMVEINEEGNIIEASTKIDLTSTEVILDLQKKFEKHVKEELVKTIKAAQKAESDIFGFGENFHKSYPKYWNHVQGDWDQIFANLDVEVKVNTFLRRSGKRSKSFLSSEG